MQYAPREPNRYVVQIIERLCHANHSDTCITSGENIRRLLFVWYGIRRSIRWVWYHLYAATREQLITRQTRWRATGGKIVLKARTRYRLAWRHLQRQVQAARSACKLLALVANPWRRETVQKSALGLQKLLSSVVPMAPSPAPPTPIERRRPRRRPKKPRAPPFTRH